MVRVDYEPCKKCKHEGTPNCPLTALGGFARSLLNPTIKGIYVEVEACSTFAEGAKVKKQGDPDGYSAAGYK